jgi:DNA polymerase
MRDAVLHELELAPLWRLRRPAASGDAADAGATVASMDWDALRAAYPELIGVGDQRADWVFAGVAFSDDSDAARLFDAMLSALQLQRNKQVFLLPVSVTDTPLARAVLSRQLALLQPRVLLALGQRAAHRLLDTIAPLDTLRGRVHDCMGTPLIASFHPDDLLKAVSSKALAWQDLCLALTTLQNNPKEIPNA